MLHEITHQRDETNRLHEFWVEELQSGKKMVNNEHKQTAIAVIKDLIWEFELKIEGFYVSKQLPICTDSVSFKVVVQLLRCFLSSRYFHWRRGTFCVSCVCVLHLKTKFADLMISRSSTTLVTYRVKNASRF